MSERVEAFIHKLDDAYDAREADLAPTKRPVPPAMIM